MLSPHVWQRNPSLGGRRAEKAAISASSGSSSKTDEVLAGRNLSGKRVLVTGVSSGLGGEAARVNGEAAAALWRNGEELVSERFS